MTTQKAKTDTAPKATPAKGKAAVSAAPVAESIIAPISAAHADAVKSIGEVVTAGQDSIDTVVKISTDAAVKARDTAQQGLDKAVALGKEQVEAAVSVGKETIESVVKVSGDVAAKGYDTAIELGRGQVEAVAKAHDAAAQGYGAAFSFGQDTLEAFVKAGNILVKGVQDLSRSVATLTQQTLEHNLAASQALLGARTLSEIVDVQNRLTRSGFDRALSEGGRLSDQSLQLIERSLEPIQQRVNATFDKLVGHG